MTAQARPVSQPQKTGMFSPRFLRRMREVSLGYFLLAPAILFLLIFELYPVLFGFYISMCDWKLSCTNFVWFDNYLKAFADPQMWHAMLVTATYSIISVPIQLGLALVMAYLLFQKIRGLTVFRMLYFLPYITTTVASAAVWVFMFSPDNGPINKLIQLVGGQPLKWLGEGNGIFFLMAQNLGLELPTWAHGPSLALITVIVYTTWVFVGYDIVIFLGGLGNISPELYDAAKVDGAQGWQLFRYITFPLLSPTTFFLLIITVIGTFKAFNHLYVMTQGGPADATTNASIFIFVQMWQYNKYGYSAALSFIVFLVILALTILQNRFAGKRVVYD